MPANPDDPTLVAACADVAIDKAVAADTTCYVQKNKFGPGRNLYWSATPFDATPTAASIAAKLAAGGLVGPIVGEYTYGGATGSTVRNNSRDIAVPTDLAWTVKITDITPATRTMARASQRGGTPGHYYVVDMNNDWHGGQNGICDGQASLLVSSKLPTGENDFQTIEGSIKGRGYFDALVIENLIPCVY